MNSTTAFAAGSGLSISKLAFLISGVACVAVLFWGAWALLSLWRGWARTRVTEDTFLIAMVRILFLVLFITWIVT